MQSRTVDEIAWLGNWLAEFGSQVWEGVGSHKEELIDLLPCHSLLAKGYR